MFLVHCLDIFSSALSSGPVLSATKVLSQDAYAVIQTVLSMSKLSAFVLRPRKHKNTHASLFVDCIILSRE